MACYNSTPFLQAALDSVLDQTWHDYELIVVDDGSTDDSPEIIRAYAERDPRIRPVFNTVNRGIHAPNVQAARLARGRYVAVLDADDIAEPERLAEQIALLEQTGAVGCLSAVTLMDAEGRLGDVVDTLFPPELVNWRLLFRYGFIHSSLMARRNALEALNYYDLRVRHAADYDLISRLARIGEIRFIKKPLVRYRVYPESYSRDRQLLINRDAELTGLTNAMILLGRPVSPGVFHCLRSPWLEVRDAGALRSVRHLAEDLKHAYAVRHGPPAGTREWIRMDLALRLHQLAERNRKRFPSDCDSILFGQPTLETVLAHSPLFVRVWDWFRDRVVRGSEGEVDEGCVPHPGIPEEERQNHGHQKTEGRPLAGRSG